MSDYTKNFDGAAKDAANSSVLGADHDVEFNAISTAIATKADKVTGATAGNLAKLDASGNLVDSDIDSADLDSLTSNVQTQINAITPAAEITSHQAAGFHQLHNGNSSVSAYDIAANVTEGTWETVGPLGSTNGVDAMDAWPITARIGIFYIYAQGETTGTSAMTLNVYTAQGSITPADEADSNLAMRVYHAPATDNVECGLGQQVLIPLNAAGEFQIWWDITNGDNAVVELTPVGFIDGLS